MKVGDKVTDTVGVWSITKIWPDGDITLVDETGYKIDVSKECFEYYYRLETKE